MKQFWHNDVTEQSFQTLIKLNQEFDFILIGGWAVYLWSQKMKSKDIDIVVTYEELAKLKQKYTVSKNTRLLKYEIQLNSFDIDIYLEYFSKIGFPLEDLKKYTQNIQGFIVPKIEILLFLKLFAYNERKNSIKGEKDKIDIVSLVDSVDVDWSFFKKICLKYNKNLLDVFADLLKNLKQIKELDLGAQKISKLKKKILAEL